MCPSFTGVMTGTRDHDVMSATIRRSQMGWSRQNTLMSVADVYSPRYDEMNGEQQPLFRRRRQLQTSVTSDRLPGYMKPTFGSSQKALLNRSRTLSLSATVTSRPQSSPVTLSSPLNLQQSMTSEKSVNSTGTGFQPQQVAHHGSTRHMIQHSQSMPLTSVEKELPTSAGRVSMRPDSSMSKDASGSLDSSTPRSGDIRRRARRIGLGLPHSSKPTSRVTAAGSGAGDSPSRAADSGSVARPTLARCATVAAAVQETISSNIDERARLSSGDVKQRVGWSRDGSGGPPATRGRNQRQTGDFVDSQPLRGYGEIEDSSAIRPGSSGRCPEIKNVAGGGASWQSRTTTRQRPLTVTQQRQPPTMTRPSTTPQSAKTTGALTMNKSVSHPSFLAMLVSGTAVAGRGAGTATGSRAAKTPNTAGCGDNNLESTATKEDENNNDDSNEDDDDEDEDEDDEDDEMKRQRIEDWLQHLETVVLDRPSTPIIDEDVPPQTDTAIHVIYDGE